MTGFEAAGSIAVVTGAASGIGAALARALHGAGARQVVLVDRAADAVHSVAGEVGGVAEVVDVTDPAAVDALVERTVTREGRIDLFCSNAGILTGVELDDPDGGFASWHRAFDVNVMGHVHAARAVLPHMLERGSGWLLNTASAAGLLISPGDAPYTATKHAAVGFAEHLAVTYGARGIGVSVLCPMGVATPLLLDPLAAGEPGAQAVAGSGEIVSPEHVAEIALTGLAQGRFLLLPHPEVATFWKQKAQDPERWLAGMRRMVSGR